MNFLTDNSMKKVSYPTRLNILSGKYFCTETKAQVPGKPVNPNAPEKPKKHKPLTSPQITLITPENDVNSLTLENAEKFAKRRGLKLVKIIDFDTKSERPLYKLMTNIEFFEENAKAKESKKKERSSLKEDKLYTLSTKISEHDLYVKINHMMKLLGKKKHAVRVYISQDGNPTRAVISFKLLFFNW